MSVEKRVVVSSIVADEDESCGKPHPLPSRLPLSGSSQERGVSISLINQSQLTRGFKGTGTRD